MTFDEGRSAVDAPPAVRVMVVEADELVRTAVAELLRARPEVSVLADGGTVEDTLSRLAEGAAPQVAVLGTAAGRVRAVLDCRALRAARPGLRCLLLTSFDDDEALLTGLLAGADGSVVARLGTSELTDSLLRIGVGLPLRDRRRAERLLEQQLWPAIRRPGHELHLDAVRIAVLQGLFASTSDVELAAELDLTPDAVTGLVAEVAHHVLPHRPG